MFWKCLRWGGLGIVVLALGSWAVATLWVQREAPPEEMDLGGAGPGKGLVIYHPSRDAGFSDKLSLAVAEGMKAAGLRVMRMTATSSVPSQAEGYALIAVVSNTYNFAPDEPTHLMLARSRWEGAHAIGLMGGAGSTQMAEQMLEQWLRATRAKVIATKSFWTMRPNDESRMAEDNVAVATDLARKFGEQSARTALGDN
jgi:hypothetical protein